jgi:hypothetical protein
MNLRSRADFDEDALNREKKRIASKVAVKNDQYSTGRELRRST